MAKTSGTAAQKTLDLLASNGWVNDQYSWRATGTFGRGHQNDPHAWVKPARDGGQWRILLDYRSRSGSWSTTYGTTLNGAKVEFIADGTEPEFNEYMQKNQLHGTQVGTLSRPSKYDSFNGLNVALGDLSLRDRVNLVIADPETTLWLAKEAEHKHSQEVAQVRQARDDRYRAQQEPLRYVEGGEHGWGSDWKRKAQKLASASDSLSDADGTTDVIKLLVEAQRAYDVLVGSLTLEGLDLLEAALLEDPNAQNLDH